MYYIITMDVVSFRLPKEIKEEMKKIDIKWSEEIRKFIEMRIKKYKKEETIRKIDNILKMLPETPKGTASRCVREDRDSN